ncbi:multiple sugar transport system permease protein [Aliiroseovarius halocynthiae]|uniref:Sugar ABC transporter permease n=1 Tax=Aliiroseovarius halocynthiae TaxID=985055 RepID=A0A545SL47_9RHOB|nr:sugar ABC transporter permease [Aliiroseovarius halocynthiae]TQV65703.1 sugar ABC transporter permease [Aliiroseovarius halocynthiae]SMR83936.1 multiple sugar transport system permease protein [Aliiroseovarius halocynthiae]
MKLSPLARERFTIFMMLFPTFLILVGFYLYPTLYNLELSFTDITLLKLRQGGDPVGLANYTEFLTSSSFFDIAINTVFWLTAISVVCRIILGLGFALLLNSNFLKRMHMTTLARLILLVPWATPPVVAVIAWRWLFDPTHGPINSWLLATGLISDPVAFTANLTTVWPSIVTIIVWNTTPLIGVSLLAALQTVPSDLLEASEIDGANRWQSFRFITLPYLMPTISVLTLMSVIWTFNNFVYVWLTTGAGPGTYTNVLATEVYLKAFVDLRLGYSAAIGVTMAIVMAAFGALYFRFFGLSDMQDKVG